MLRKGIVGYKANLSNSYDFIIFLQIRGMHLENVSTKEHYMS